MVRAVRNWWLDADIDGRKSTLYGGPENKEGGFSLHLYQRDNGSVTLAGKIYGLATSDGKLILRGNIGDIEFEHITKR